MNLPSQPFYSLIRYSTMGAFRLFIDIDHKRETTSYNGPHIFAANHPSTLDPLMVMTVLPHKVSALLTGGAFEIPVFGRLLSKAGHIPVYENQGSTAYGLALKKLLHGESILIFPEGSLSEENHCLKPLYSGAIRLAQESNLPIVPVGISYSNHNIYKHSLTLNGKREHARFVTHGHYAVTLGDPFSIPTDNQDLPLYKHVLATEIQSLVNESAARLQESPTSGPLLGRGIFQILSSFD